MKDGPATLQDSPAPTPAPPELIEHAWSLVRQHPEARIRHLEDVRLADEQPDLPIGVAFVDQQGRPCWPGDDSSLRIHTPSIRGCWPDVHGIGER